MATNKFTGVLGHSGGCKSGHVRSRLRGRGHFPSSDPQVHCVLLVAVVYIAVAFKIFGGRAGEVAQHLRARAVLTEDSSFLLQPLTLIALGQSWASNPRPSSCRAQSSSGHVQVSRWICVHSC